MKRLAVVGANGHGKVIADLAEQLGYLVSFFDDAYPELKEVEHWSVVGGLSDLVSSSSEFTMASVAIGDSQIRERMLGVIEQAGISLPTLVHPTAIVSSKAVLKEGCQVLPGAIVNAFAQAGRGCIINTGAIVEHDCSLGDFSHVCPGATLGGGVQLGRRVWFGVGSCAKQLVKIGDGTVVGAGSVVVSDIPQEVVAFGSPARVV